MADTDEDDNPYVAPKTTVLSVAPRDRTKSSRWQIAWSVVYGINLIFPLLIGWFLANPTGRLGIVIAILLMWLIGHLAVARSVRFRFTLVAGGICVGLSQVFPLLHYFAGTVGLEITSRLLRMPSLFEDDTRPEITTGLAGFPTTILTGGILMVAALACGQILFLITNAGKPRNR